MSDIIHERVSLFEPAESRLGHEARYHLAAGYCQPGDAVVDAACGVGYGRPILTARGGVRYTGVERDLSVVEVERGYLELAGSGYIEADLNTWAPAGLGLDVVVAFETLEHLDDMAAYLAWTARARLLLVSVPLGPTVHENRHHRRDFLSRDEVPALYPAMVPIAYFWQADEHSAVYVLRGAA